MNHIFWSGPRAPLLRNGPIPTRPMRMGGRFIELDAGPFLGQASGNRLDGLSIPAIVGRVQISPVVQAYNDAVSKQPRGAWSQTLQSPGLVGTPPNFPPMTAAEQQTLLEISQDPTDDELKDLAVIDEFFNSDFSSRMAKTFYEPSGSASTGTFLTTYDLCSALRNPDFSKNPFKGGRLAPPDGLEYWLTYVPVSSTVGLFSHPTQGGSSMAPDILDNKFFCPDAANLPAPATDRNYGPDLAYTAWFSADPQGTWGNARTHVENAITMMDQLNSYPYPPPIDLDSRVFKWQPQVRSALMTISGYDGSVDPEVFRSWITLSVLSSYDSMVTAIEADQKRAARNAKRKALIKMIGIGIAGIVLSFVIPGIIMAAISLIKAAIDTYIAVEARKRAVQQMVDASKLFEADAPAFSAEIQKTADMLDASAAEEQANVPLTPDQQAALQEVQANMPPNPTVTVLAVGGGVAAVGVALFALLRR